MLRRLLTGAAAAAAVLALAGCTASSPGATGAGQSGAESSASSTRAAQELCSTGPGEECPVGRGHYAVPEFTPPVAFDLADDWTNSGVAEHLVTFLKPGTSDEYFEFASDVTQGLNDGGGEITRIENTPEGFVKWLGTRKTLTVEEPVKSTLGGAPATRIDVVAKEETDLYRYNGVVATYHVVPGQRIRFVTAMVQNTRVQVAAEAPDAKFDALWKRVAPILESVTFGGR